VAKLRRRHHHHCDHAFSRWTRPSLEGPRVVSLRQTLPFLCLDFHLECRVEGGGGGGGRGGGAEETEKNAKKQQAQATVRVEARSKRTYVL
jgi:hypothetical protein